MELLPRQAVALDQLLERRYLVLRGWERRAGATTLAIYALLSDRAKTSSDAPTE